MEYRVNYSHLIPNIPLFHQSNIPIYLIFACAAASLAIGTLKGEQLT